MLKELSEDLNSIKKSKAEMKYTLIEIKDNLKGNKSRVNETENHINDLEHKELKNKPIRTRRKKIPPPKKNEDNISSLWNKLKRSNIHIIGIQEAEEKKQETESLFEKIM